MSITIKWGGAEKLARGKSRVTSGVVREAFVKILVNVGDLSHSPLPPTS